jgi:hypothetical protein
MVANGQNHMLPELSKVYRLILTLPATSCSCERSFSALKFVKNRLRTTMNQERLADLLVIAVECERKNCISPNDIAEHFWNNFSVDRR